MCCFSRICLWKTVAIYSMVVSCIMVIAAIFSILIYDCRFPELAQFQATNAYYVYISYFFNPTCSTGQLYTISTLEFARKTWHWALTYLIINSFWFFTSLRLLLVPKLSDGKLRHWLTYSWLLVTLVVLIVDVAASILYGKDFDKFETFEKFQKTLGLIGAVPPEDGYIPLQIVVMISIFSKAIIFWIINFMCFVTISLLRGGTIEPEETTLYLETRASAPDFYYPSASNPSYEEETNVPQPDFSPRVNNRESSLVDNIRDISQQYNNWQGAPATHAQSRNFGPGDVLDGWTEFRGSPKYFPQSSHQQKNHAYSARDNHSTPWTYLPPEQHRDRWRAEDSNNIFKKHQQQNQHMY